MPATAVPANPVPATGLRALLVENIDPEARQSFEQAGIAVESLDRALDENELIERLPGVHLLGVRSKTAISAAAIDAGSDLLAIGAFCVGVNHLDLDAAAAAGVAVFNAPFSNTRSVVELAICEIIAMARQLLPRSNGVQRGLWNKSSAGCHEVRGRTLGIVGYGNVGSQLSVLAENLGMRVLFYDVSDKLARGNAMRCDTLDELLGAADVVTLHVDGRPANRDLFGEAQFAAMKPGSMFLNLSRGFIIDDEALRAHLDSGHLAGAAIDVFPVEPAGKEDAFTSALQGCETAILTPHIGGATEEAQSDIGRYVAGKLRDYVTLGTTSMSVNLPELSLPRHAGQHRFTYLHRNTPGALAAVNEVFGSRGVNIEAQLLATRGSYGYVVTDVADVAASNTEGVLAGLKAIPGAIKSRATR